VNHFLYKLYFWVPPRFRRRVKSIITKIENGQMYSETLREIHKKETTVEVGYGSYGGCFSKLHVPPGVSFGNYCSIAPNIRIFRANHPVEKFTTHPLLYNPVAGYVEEDKLKRPELVIGHDVWIGEWTIILPSVNKIGNGAIIGAGSVVTKDVPPYTVVAGNPARIIKQRFNDFTIESLEKSEWWYLKKDALIEQIDLIEELQKDKIIIS
jgi:virginiamycin A acetyltransferase